MKSKWIGFFATVLFMSNSYGEVICFEAKQTTLSIDNKAVKKETCIEVGDGNDSPVVVGGSGGCGGSSACGGNSHEAPKILLDHSKDLQKIMKDYKVDIRENVRR